MSYPCANCGSEDGYVDSICVMCGHDGAQPAHDGRHGIDCPLCWDYEHDDDKPQSKPWHRLMSGEIRTVVAVAVGFGLAHVLKVLT